SSASARQADEAAALGEPVRQGERAAFEQIVRKYQKQIYFLTVRQVGDMDEAMELTQRAFVKAFEGLAHLRGAAQFRTWLYRIAINLTLNHLRDHSKFIRNQQPEDRPQMAPSAVERLGQAAEAGQPRRAGPA